MTTAYMAAAVLAGCLLGAAVGAVARLVYDATRSAA